GSRRSSPFSRHSPYGSTNACPDRTHRLGSGHPMSAQPSVGMPAAPAMSLRGWQREALARYLAAGTADYLVTATPGAGKTTFALAVAATLLGRRAIDRVIVVCPTDHLRTQWADAASAVGLALDPTLSNAVG